MVEFSRKKLFRLAITLLFIALFALNCHPAQTTNLDPLRLQKMVNRFSWQDAKNTYPKSSLLFVGSSSIYRWKTAYAFPDHPVINRGIPGAEIADLNYYYGDLVEKYRAATVIFYCGDNDIANGKPPRQVVVDFKTFSAQLTQHNPKITLLFLAIKPSPLRWQLWDKMAETNRRIHDFCQKSSRCKFIDTATPLLNKEGLPEKTLFAKDGIHLNPAGYKIWNDIVMPHL